MNMLMVDGLQPVRYPGEVLPWQRRQPTTTVAKQPRVLAPQAEAVAEISAGGAEISTGAPHLARPNVAQPNFARLDASRHLIRLALFAAIGVLVVSSAGYLITSRATSTPSRSLSAATDSSTKAPAPTPKPTTPAASAAASSAQLQQTLNQFVVSAGAPFYILVRNLSTGATASINPSQVMESASLYKLFVANQIYLLADKGQINLNSTTGEGVNETITQCLSNMITWSDNTCGRALGARIGWQAQAGSLAQQGITKTDLYSDPTRTNVNDVATLYENLYAGKYLSQASTVAFLSLLKEQTVNNRLPIGLPTGTVIAHKTGDLDGYMHDAGIVYGPKTNYLIVAMSGPWSNPNDSFAAFGKLSQEIYQQLEQ